MIIAKISEKETKISVAGNFIEILTNLSELIVRIASSLDESNRALLARGIREFISSDEFEHAVKLAIRDNERTNATNISLDRNPITEKIVEAEKKRIWEEHKKK